jgi:cytochrome d ubiquinol oxidase subunit II
VATFFQGVILGAYVQGIEVEGRSFAGGAFDWFSAFSMMTGLALVSGYVYLGSAWLVMRTEGDIQEWAYGIARKALFAVAGFMALVSLWMPFLHSDIPFLSAGFDEILRTGLIQRWFGGPQMFFTSLVPLGFIAVTAFAWHSLRKKAEFAPFICGMLIFVTGFAGLAISIWPHVIPYSINLFDAAAAPSSQLLMLVGALILLPVILGYTAYIYWLFRGKVGHDDGYHH